MSSSIPSSPFSVDALGEYSSGDYDPEYECDAPKYVDLLRQNSENPADEWFGMVCLHLLVTKEDKTDTPLSKREYEPEPLLDSSFLGQNTITGTPEKEHCENSDILDENTPTPKASKTQEFESAITYDAEDEVVQQLTGKFSNLRFECRFQISTSNR